MDTDAEGEDNDILVLEAPPAGTERSGVRRLVVLGAQTQVDPVDPLLMRILRKVLTTTVPTQRASIH